MFKELPEYPSMKKASFKHTRDPNLIQGIFLNYGVLSSLGNTGFSLQENVGGMGCTGWPIDGSKQGSNQMSILLAGTKIVLGLGRLWV